MSYFPHFNIIVYKAAITLVFVLTTFANLSHNVNIKVISNGLIPSAHDRLARPLLSCTSRLVHLCFPGYVIFPWPWCFLHKAWWSPLPSPTTPLSLAPSPSLYSELCPPVAVLQFCLTTGPGWRAC